MLVEMDGLNMPRGAVHTVFLCVEGLTDLCEQCSGLVKWKVCLPGCV